MRLIIGNLAFVAVVATWYAAFGGGKAVLLVGTGIIFVAFVVGTCMGYALGGGGATAPRGNVRRPGRAAVDCSVFNHIR